MIVISHVPDAHKYTNAESSMRCISFERTGSLPVSSAQVSIALVASFKRVCSEMTQEQQSDTAIVREVGSEALQVCSSQPFSEEI